MCPSNWFSVVSSPLKARRLGKQTPSPSSVSFSIRLVYLGDISIRGYRDVKKVGHQHSPPIIVDKPETGNAPCALFYPYYITLHHIHIQMTYSCAATRSMRRGLPRWEGGGKHPRSGRQHPSSSPRLGLPRQTDRQSTGPDTAIFRTSR